MQHSLTSWFVKNDFQDNSSIDYSEKEAVIEVMSRPLKPSNQLVKVTILSARK